MPVQVVPANLPFEKCLRRTFAGASATARRRAWTVGLALLGLGLNGALLWQLAVVQEEVSWAQARWTELANARRDPARRAPQPWQGLAPKAATAWQAWEQALNQPWPSLFELIERNRVPGVLVQQMQAEQREGELQLTARAASLELLQDWAARLRKDAETKRLRVLKLAVQEADASPSSAPGYEIRLALRLHEAEGGTP